MQGAHATTRRLTAVVVFLAIAGAGCATGSSPTPAASAAPATPAPTAEPATSPSPAAVPSPGSPAPSALEPPFAYGQIDPIFYQSEPEFIELEDSAQLTIAVTDLRAMTGLDLAIALDYYVSASEVIGNNLLRLPIDASPYAASTQPVPVPSGRFRVHVFAGQPPCSMGWLPQCGVQGSADQTPEYGCRMWVDIEPGDDRSIAVAGLPKLRPGVRYNYPDCGVAAG